MITIKIAKVHALEVDVEKFSDEVRAFIFDYGLRQVLADAGSTGKSAEEKLGMAQKKLDGLYAGTIRTARGTKAEPTGLEAMVMKIATATVKDAARRKGKTAEQIKAGLAAWVAAYVASAGEKLRVEAQARLDAAEDAAGELDDIL